MNKSSPDQLPETGHEIKRGLTPGEKFSLEMQSFLGMITRVGAMALVFSPMLITALLVIDIPVRFLNPFFALMPGLMPTQWLNWGSVILAMVPLAGILFARRYGGEDTSRAIILSWVILAAFILFELSVLSPVIEDGDFPAPRFMIAIVSSAMFGQLVTIAFYDVLRGGEPWWRGPFYAALTGFFVTTIIYFPIAYWHSEVSWGVWLIGDLMVKTIFAVGFLPLYFVMRKKLKPRRGYGAI